MQPTRPRAERIDATHLMDEKPRYVYWPVPSLNRSGSVFSLRARVPLCGALSRLSMRMRIWGAH